MKTLPSLGGLALAVSSLAAACGGADGSAPTAPTPVASVPSAQPATAAPPRQPAAGGGTAPAPSPLGPQPSWTPGQPVTARGTISNTPWQHLMAAMPGKLADYFDLEDGGQTVIYVDQTPQCPGLVEVEGVVLEVRGPSKRPGRQESKVDETYSELHIDVTRHRCVP